MRMISLLAVVAIALAVPVTAQTVPPADDEAMPTDAHGYIARAAASDQFEIQSSELALQTSSSASVKRLATMMIADHGKTMRDLARAAQKAGITPPPPPPLDATQQAMMGELHMLKGSAFDATWLRQQGMAHEMALELDRGYAAAGDTPALKTAARGAVTVVRRHIAMLKAAGAPL